MDDIVRAIKRAATEAVAAADPMAIRYGQVTSVIPLKILVEQKLTLTSVHLILTHNVVDYDVNMTADGGGTSKVTVHNGLEIGDGVILVRTQGGQKYIVLDKEVKV
ncbi:DUF2577 domain-containing protein [Paenibacillus sp. FA6]|uniref:DUF2577 domain-containing protein n=1 Tax=Paenibacillus sp. FA6 TaxID=3413029 RepID=UPI003F660783